MHVIVVKKRLESISVSTVNLQTRHSQKSESAKLFVQVLSYCYSDITATMLTEDRVLVRRSVEGDDEFHDGEQR